MSTIADITSRVQDRLEENPPAFWSVSGELYPLIVEAMNAAAIITGEPQVRASQIYTIVANLNPTGFTSLPLPDGAIALLRVDAAGGVPMEKMFVWDLDKHYPGWELETGPQAKAWFPFGLTRFGIYPNLTADQQVILTYIATPVITPRPYVGTEAVPFQDEYREAFEDYAAAMARLKEGGAEFDQAQIVIQRFLSKMEQMSNFAYRKGSLRFSRTAGAQSKINEVTVK